MSEGGVGDLRDQVVKCIDESQHQKLSDLFTEHAEEICNMKDEEGECLLIRALNLESFNCAQLLLSRGANPNVKSLDKTPAWDFAIQTDAAACLESMFEHGLKVDRAAIMKVLDEYDPINRVEFEAVINRFCPMSEGRDDGGEWQSKKGNKEDLADAISFSIDKNRPKKLANLIAKDPETVSAACEIQDKNGNVPLIGAVHSERLECLKHLLEAGASPNVKAGDGTEAWQLAIQQNKPCILRLLFKHGLTTERKTLEAYVTAQASDEDDIKGEYMAVITEHHARRVVNATAAIAAGKPP
jgi:hypothetical protein